MAWEHLTDYLKGSLNSLGRALNIHLNNNLNGGRNVEDPATFERWKAELAASISIRQMDSSALVSLGRRGFHNEFRFWVRLIVLIYTVLIIISALLSSPKAWAHILNAKDFSEEDYNELLIDCFGTVNPSHIQAPFFGSSVNLTPLRLTDNQIQDLTKILYLIAHRHPHFEFIPIFPAIAAIFISYYPDRLVFPLLEVFIKTGNSGSSSNSEMKEWPFFPQNRRESLIFSRIFDDLLLKFVPNVSRHILKIQGREPQFNPRWNRLLSEFFIGILPNSYIFKIFDAYLIEGYKVPIRFALAHVALQQENLLKCQTGAEFKDCLINCFTKPSMENVAGSSGTTGSGFPPYSFKVLQKTAYSLKFSRNILVRFKNRHRKLSLEDFEDGDRALMLHKPLPKLSRTSQFLNDQDWANIWQWIPARFRILDLELLFVSSEHGYRLGTLFEKATDSEPLILAIETTDGNIFGAYLSKSLKNRTSRKLFGTGESFIVNLRPAAQSYSWNEACDNQQFIYADENFLAIGCSSGKFGIWIDRDLNQVVSSPCDTFRNPSFIENESGWSDIYCIELYRFK